MSIYDHRDKPAYPALDEVPVEWAENPLILAWWTEAHDAVLKGLVSEWQWVWSWKALDPIVAITPKEALATWQKKDKLCKRFAWYNIIGGFCRARAVATGLTNSIRSPERRTCLLCGEAFIEDSLPMPLIERLGTERLTHCAPCLRDSIFYAGDPAMSQEQILAFAVELARIAGRVPSDGFGNRKEDFLGLDDATRTELLKALHRKPSKQRVTELFGSWFDVLVQAGVLEDGARRTSRGTQCHAIDGHVCLSLGEKTIDDLLHSYGLAHTKEPHYPESNMRADFDVSGVFIEYFGLVGDPEYDAKTKSKMTHAKKHRLKLIAIYPKDVASGSALSKKLASLLEVRNGAQPLDG